MTLLSGSLVVLLFSFFPLKNEDPVITLECLSYFSENFLLRLQLVIKHVSETSDLQYPHLTEHRLAHLSSKNADLWRDETQAALEAY